MATTDITMPFFMPEEVQALAKSTAEGILRDGDAGAMSPAVQDFVAMLNTLAKGEAVSAFPVHSELTVNEAANILGSSDSYLLALLDSGEIPFREEPNRRLVRLDDLLRYKQEKKRLREAVLDEMTREAQEMGLYD